MLYYFYCYYYYFVYTQMLTFRMSELVEITVTLKPEFILEHSLQQLQRNCHKTEAQ